MSAHGLQATSSAQKEPCGRGVFGQPGPSPVAGLDLDFPSHGPSPAHIPSLCPLSSVLFFLLGVSNQTRSWPGL